MANGQSWSVIGGERAPLNRLVAGIAFLTLLRFVLAATLPPAFDEAYYWLWSKHLAASYYDHPPAIAYAIRAGTTLFGQSAFALRFAPLLMSMLASWAVWRSAELVLADRHGALLACLYFNLTLMVASQSMAATPDAPALAASALVLFFLAKIATGSDGRWWLALGAAGGLCLISKYTGFFLGAGILVWLIAAREGRRWLVTPWPYLGGILAIAIFSPVIAWNAAHDWISFKFQFGRTETGGLTTRYFGEFLFGQLGLASPFILALSAAGFVRGTRAGHSISTAALPVWPALVYFLVHATHDRVQGNWPSFLYPSLAILAAYAARGQWQGSIARPALAVARSLAIPAAALILAAVYAEAFFAVVPERDPIARLTAVGFRPVADDIARIAERRHARAIVTSSYATTAWLAYYATSGLPIVPVTEPFRWQFAPDADPALAQAPLLFVAQEPRKASQAEIIPPFATMHLEARLTRKRRGAVIDRYDVYSVSGYRGRFAGWMP